MVYLFLSKKQQNRTGGLAVASRSVQAMRAHCGRSVEMVRRLKEVANALKGRLVERFQLKSLHAYSMVRLGAHDD